MRNTFFLLFLLFCNSLAAQQQHFRVEILAGTQSLSELSRLGIETDHGIRRGNHSFITDLSESEIQRVKDAGYQVNSALRYPERGNTQVVNSRSGQCTFEEVPFLKYSRPVNYQSGSMGGYHTLAEMEAVLDSMRSLFPGLISVRQKLHPDSVTVEGRPVWFVKISDNPDAEEEEPEILYTALHHAREPHSLEQLLYFMWFLLENYSADARIKYLIDQTELFFVPCINPDGYAYNEIILPNGGGMWRKNRRFNSDGSFGVDLNRNYGFQWGFDDEGSSPLPFQATYRGTESFSEPETRMIRDFCLNRQFRYALNYHSFGKYLIYPWAYQAASADTAFQILSEIITLENSYFPGTTEQTVGYPVNGNSDDWMYAEAGIMAFTPEVGGDGFWPSPDLSEQISKENLWANLCNAQFALQFVLAEDLQEPYLTAYSVNWPVKVRRLGEEDGPVSVFLEPGNGLISALLPPLLVDLQRFESDTLVFQVQISPAAQSGDTIAVVIAVDHGKYIARDTVYKILGAKMVRVVDDSADDPDVWTGNWARTSSAYFSPPYCWTDSPDAVYNSLDYNVLTLNQSIFIPDSALAASLLFRAFWDIEAGYDYVQLLLKKPGESDVALCGRYSVLGTDFQSPGEPVWDDFKTKWVEERIDLMPYRGQNFTLEFLLAANAQIEGDGFYFDDFRVEYLLGGKISPVEEPRYESFRVFPNPSNGQVFFQWSAEEAYKITVTDVLGRIIESIPVFGSGEVALNLPPGVFQVGLHFPQNTVTRVILVKN